MKIQVIECCDECLDSRITFEKGYAYICQQKDKKVKEGIDFPEWCPLYEAKDANEKIQRLLDET